MSQPSPVPVVSVIVPTFNRLRFLRPAIESAFAQTFTDWELIIADDGSDLATRQYLQSLAKQPRVTVLWLAHTGRPSVVRNKALLGAVGEYVAFLDSDDLWAARKLERQLEALRGRLQLSLELHGVPASRRGWHSAPGGDCAALGAVRGRHF